MTSRLLLAGDAGTGMRDALRGAGATEVLSRRGLSVRAACLPLFARSATGALVQAVRVTADTASGPPLTVRLLRDDEPCDSAELSAGASRYLFVPEVDQPSQFTVEVSDATGVVGSATITVPPQRKSELAHQAADDAEDLRRAGLHRFGARLGRPPGVLASYLVAFDVRSAFVGTSLERDLRPVPVLDGTVRVVVPAGNLVALVTDLAA